MGIRDVRKEDCAQIAAIYNIYVSETTATFEMLPVADEEMERRVAEISSRYPYIIYEENDRILGYCYAHPWKKLEAYRSTLETTIYLHPDAQGRGIGTMLMEKLIPDCRDRGFHALIACITADNIPSINLHEKLSFRRASLFREVGFKFGQPLDVIDLELIL